MILKRQFDDEEGNDSPMSNQPRNPKIKFQKVVNHVMKDLSLQEFATKISAILEPTLRRVVREELNSLLVSLPSSSRHSLVHQPGPSSSRDLQLCFINGFPPTLFTNTIVRDAEHAFLQIMLVDARSKRLIQHGPLSSIKVEVFVLSADFTANGKDDWTEAEFSQSIVREREGKRPLLVGDLSFSLANGIGMLENVVFTDNSSWVRSRKFRLGIKAVPSVSCVTGIKEAVSEAFVVLDHRGESYQKHDRPSLDDPVWRLKKISKMGASHKKLEAIGINTVKDFLIHYHVDPSSLRDVLGKGVANKAWETMVKHANECHLDNTIYSYFHAAEKIELFFNCVYKVISVRFDSQIYQPDALDVRQKALVDELKKVAFVNQNELVLIHGSSATPPLDSSITSLGIPFPGANLDVCHDGLSVVNQGGLEHHPEFNLSDSASYPCKAEDVFLQGDDSTAQSEQPLQMFAPAALWSSDPAPPTFTPEPSQTSFNWYQTCLVSTFNPKHQSGEPSYSQITTLNGFLTTGATPTITDIFSRKSPTFKAGNPGNRRRRAGWCKLRAALMWKIVRRDVARRRAKTPFFFY